MVRSPALAYQHLLLALDVLELVGFFGEQCEVDHLPDSGNILFGVGSELVNNDLDSSKQEGFQDPKRGQPPLIEVSSCLPSSPPHCSVECQYSSNTIPAPLHYRHLQRLKIQSVAAGGYDMTVLLTPEAHWELNWWITSLENSNSRKIRTSLPDMVIHRDASLVGWGANSKSMNIGGEWNREEQSMHINWLELRAAWLARSLYTKEEKSEHPSLSGQPFSDGIYQPHGGTCSDSLSLLAVQFWLGLWPGRLSWKLNVYKNVQADWMSRVHQDRPDWKLCPTIFSRINDLWGPLQVDLFATWLSAQLDWFYSWKLEPSVEAIDTLLQDLLWEAMRTSLVLAIESTEGSSRRKNDPGCGNSFLSNTALVSSTSAHVNRCIKMLSCGQALTSV